MSSPSAAAARRLVAALVDQGVRHAVLCPGSRSAPLAYALADAADDGRLTVHVRIDERSAGFLALGLARGAVLDADRPEPVAVVTTSGTAAANLHPAVLEAYHAGVALLVLTADRPHELRGTGANQVTDQPGMFGSAVRWAADVPAPVGSVSADAAPAGAPDTGDRDVRALAARAVAAATGARSGWPGPVHLNLAYRDPLVPAEGSDPRPAAAVGPVTGDAIAVGPVTVVVPGAAGRRVDPGLDWALDDAPTVLVAGDGAGTLAGRLAAARGWPLLAESVSGAGGPALVSAHAQVLTHSPLTHEVRRAVVLGRPTLSRPVQALLARPDVDVLVVTPGAGPWPDAARGARAVLPAVPAAWLEPDEGAGRSWVARWREAGQAASRVVRAEIGESSVGAAGQGLAGEAVAAEVAHVLGPDDVLVVGSSNPVRDLDLVADWTEPPRVVANRGLAGIDGLISTATGVALRTGGLVRLYVGDLTFLHDIGGLLGAPGETPAHLQIVVANDDGGSIFSGLEHGALAATTPRAAARFERVFSTPHGADLGALCAGYGVAHRAVADRTALRAALAEPAPGISVVEVRVDRARRTADRRRRAAALRAALGRECCARCAVRGVRRTPKGAEELTDNSQAHPRRSPDAGG
ncbi:MAG: 2-succinyl-5-enolpyruvyl-6-hydroxy-3-cyclohexene-1-carboxylic-acid synthase [Cellulomonadaceae bacterium]